MKKPIDYELKKWLCSNTICGLMIHHYQVGVDTSDTDWEMTTTSGKTKRVKSHRVKGLVNIRPDWVRVMSPTREVVSEIGEWDKFAKKEARDLAEFARLKEKFES